MERESQVRLKSWGRVLAIILIVFLITLAHSSCWMPKEERLPEDLPDQPVTTEPSPSEITLLAVGDCLMHNTQIWSGQQADGSYNFDFFFSEVEELIKQADYSMVSFEAPMAGSESSYTGYPLFNSPDAMADTFKRAGFDLVTTANNHAFDRGYAGLLRSLEVLEKAGLDTVGTYATQEASQAFLIKDIKGIKVGYLAYSYGTNGIPIPQDKPYCFNLLEREKVLYDIQRLRPQVDVLVLILHWGTEYMHKPKPEQVDMAHEFLNAGADIILGSHPHVIQPLEVINIEQKDKMVIYSMGNFISHQHGLERNSGIILRMKFIKDFKHGVTRLVQVGYIPTFSHSYYEEDRIKFRVVTVEKTLEDIKMGRETILSQEDIPVLEQVLESTSSLLGEVYREKC
jgi:hypothetical protein